MLSTCFIFLILQLALLQVAEFGYIHAAGRSISSNLNLYMSKISIFFCSFFFFFVS